MNQKLHSAQFLLILVSLIMFALLTSSSFMKGSVQQGGNSEPPDYPVKLIFIHHSTGENWLEDGYGNLGRTLENSNYFVSDTNYGWGPNNIGDRTDIPNWMEWFRSGDTPIIMEALFNETGQNSNYIRNLTDPGGENQIIMFKSCFPNSELAGFPNDPPGTDAEMTVSGAKFVYTELLNFFRSHPDKLFIVITAPPLSDPTYAANARGFNSWLVFEWLQVNNYSLNNVAVFDFYNVLTGPEAHHSVVDGEIVHIKGNLDTLFYPSDDDHPSEEGSRKATQDFVPLLNLYYHRWIESDPHQPKLQTANPTVTEPPIKPFSASQESGLIDDFELDNPPGTNGWEPFRDESTNTSMHCAVESSVFHSGKKSLIFDFEVTQGSWATCALFYETPQNWSDGEGVMFFYHAVQPGKKFDVHLYIDGPNGRETYSHSLETTQSGVDGDWEIVTIPWFQFKRVDWEDDAGTPFSKEGRISGIAFGFEDDKGAPNVGRLWIDDLSLVGLSEKVPAPLSGEDNTGEDTSGIYESQPSKPSIPCSGSIAIPFGMVLASIWLNWVHRYED